MIENTLRELHEAVETINNPASLQILNIDTDALALPETTREYIERYRAWTQLLHISRSIPDLLQQSDSPALIGFLGHFSSGKSSLINALLEIPSTETPGYKREVGQHPTDTSITLITHRDHAHLVKKSAYTAIDAIEVVHGPSLEFLEHATFVDTPGLGNEAAELEAVTRFLHLCHVLVITIDGRRPFADKDKDFALLDTAFNKLKGVPKILVVTSAEEFLVSRMASFETGWQADRADAFWDEAIERLKRDSRFQDHVHRLKIAPRFFVDSKDGFQVDQVSNELLPIVKDDAHRARIRNAQGKYVLATADEALRVLLEYISARSDRLNRLHRDARNRANGTATAVEELLQSLESSFGEIRERLNTARQATPSIDFAVDTIVTPQVVSAQHDAAISDLESEICGAMKQRLSEARTSLRRRARQILRRRSRPWSLSKNATAPQIGLRLQFRVDADIPGLAVVTESCARSALNLVNQKLATAITTASQHLRDTSEAWAIGSATSDIKSSLDRFQGKHDDSIKAFYAHISAPRSSDLLREHGVIGFNRSGEPAVQIESIAAVESPRFSAIFQCSEDSKDRLRKLSHERGEELGLPSEEAEPWSPVSDGDHGADYREDVARHINSVCQRTFDEFVSGLTDYTNDLAERSDDARDRAIARRHDIWAARATLVRRFAWIAVAGAIGLVALFASGYTDGVASVLSDNLPALIGGAISTVGIIALVYFLSGAKNDTVRAALRFVLMERWRFSSESRGLETTLGEHFDKSYEQMIDDVERMSLTIAEALADGIVKRIKSTADSESHRKVDKMLAVARSAIKERSRLFDEYHKVVDRELAEIPKELEDTADAIKKDTIEKHLSRIQEAVGSVDGVRSDVQRIADIAARHSEM